MNILLVKTSSMGDVINNLPVASDILGQFPDARIDWVVEETFSDIPRLHPGVRNVLPIAIRRWRKGFWNHDVRQEMKAFRNQLQSTAYDFVIDSQGLVKSALVTWLAKGIRCGFDRRSAWEPIATYFYDRKFPVDPGLHAVVRYRQLAAQALGYTVPEGIDYGIRTPDIALPWLPSVPYGVLLHGTSRPEKLWPEQRWLELGQYFHQQGILSVLPWGNASEKQRSEALASQIPEAVVSPALRLNEAATMLGRAKITIGVDTGLAHLSAALQKPTIAIFCGSNPAHNGLYASTPVRNLGNEGAPPAVDEVITAFNELTS